MNNIQEATRRILEDDKPSKIYKKLPGYILPRTFFRICVWMVFAIFSSNYTYFAVTSDNVRENISLICDLLLPIILSILGIAITGYAIFQAFLSPKNIVFLLNVVNKKDDGANDKVSVFEQYNFCFYALSVMSCITLLYCTVLKLTVMSQTVFLIYMSVFFTRFILLFLLIFLPLIVIYDMLSFIYSIYQVFTMQAALSAAEHMKEVSKKTQPTGKD